MIDLKQLRADPEAFRRALGRKRYRPETLDELLACDARRRELLQQVEELKALKNRVSKEIPRADKETRPQLIAQMKETNVRIGELEAKLKECESELHALVIQVPNPPHESVPDGVEADETHVVRVVGQPPKFEFETRDHLELGEALGWIDVRRAARTSGSRFAYLMRQAVQIEFALVQFALAKLVAKGFVPVVPPVIVRERAMFGTGFFPAEEFEIYRLEGEDAYLVGTSEVSLAALHDGEILDEQSLPLRYAGFSTCFRKEAGSYGRDTRGIFRVHQFDKVEMFSFCHPERSWDEHESLLAIEEEIIQDLGLAYRVVNIPAGDLGAPAAKKYDIEVWFPGQKRYRELTSCSNCTDFQARRLMIRFRQGKKTRLVHTLNGTAVAIGRTLIAIMENFQQSDGTIAVPEVLEPFMFPMPSGESH
jgi:seryl-tRNA synthetase